MKQPKSFPDGYVPLRFAAMLTAQTLAGKNLVDGLDEVMARGEGPPAISVSTFGAWAKSSGYTERAAMVGHNVARLICRAARSGAIGTAYAPKGAGMVQPMPDGAWQTDDYFLRFKGYGFDPQAWGAEGDGLPCWVYAATADVEALRVFIRDWAASLPKYDGQQDGNATLEGWPVYVAEGHVMGGAVPPDYAPKRSISTKTAANDRNVVTPSAKEEGLRRFVRWFDALENPPCHPHGDAFFYAYEDWCRNNGKPSYVRSSFYDMIRKVRP